MSYLHALEALQWSSHIEVDQEGETVYYDGLDFEPSEDLKQRIKREWDSFEEQALDLGFDPEIHRLAPYDPTQGNLWDYVAHDFILTRNGHGSGFWEPDRYEKPWGDKLTQLSKTYQEIDLYLSDNNLLEAD